MTAKTPATIPPATTAPNTSPLTCTPALILRPPLLVLPYPALSFSECPFDVASTKGSTVAVFMVFVCAEVVNVLGDCPRLTNSSLLFKNTNAKPGALTGITHSLVPVLQGMSTTLSAPLSRPSTSNLLPNVFFFETN